MSDELNIIFNKDCSYEKKVEEVKKLANKHLEESNLYLLNSIYYIGIGLFFYHSLFMFFPFIPLIFGFGFISFGCFDMFLNRKKTGKDMLNHVENSNGSLFTENNNNNNNIRKKKVKELKEKKESEEQKSKKFMKRAIILMILSLIFIPAVSFISSSFIIPVGLGMSIAQIPSLVKFVQSIKKQELIQGEIDKLNFDILSYEDSFSEKKNHTINSDNLNNKKTKNDKVYSKQFDNSIDAYLNYISKSGNVLEDERPKTYSK